MRGTVVILLILNNISGCADFPDYVISDNSRIIDERYPEYIGHWACSGLDDYYMSMQAMNPRKCDRIARATLECKEFGTNCEYASLHAL